MSLDEIFGTLELKTDCILIDNLLYLQFYQTTDYWVQTMHFFSRYSVAVKKGFLIIPLFYLIDSAQK